MGLDGGGWGFSQRDTAGKKSNYHFLATARLVGNLLGGCQRSPVPWASFWAAQAMTSKAHETALPTSMPQVQI